QRSPARERDRLAPAIRSAAQPLLALQRDQRDPELGDSVRTSLELAAFEVGSLCWESVHTLTYSGVRKSEHSPVLLRTLRSAEPRPDEIAAFRRDHEIARS